VIGRTIHQVVIGADSAGGGESGGRDIELGNANWKLKRKIEEMERNTKRD